MSDLPKLKMAASESPEDLARRFERERRATELQREDRLTGALGKFCVGSVPYLNAVPLTRGLEDEIQFVAPSKLGEMLRAGELDAALLSITETLFNDTYDILDGIAIASLGEVKSVFLAHREPLEKIRAIHCDTASLTSVNLLRALLDERGLKPEFLPLPSYERAREFDNVLLIGDPAIDFLRAQIPAPTHVVPPLGGPVAHEIWDLGAAWFELTRLPFVYAVWVLRRGIENTELKRQLREAKSFGLETLDHIINTRPEYDLAFRKDYLGWHVHYHLGADEKRGIAKFVELLRKHRSTPVYDPRFV
jgi:chorismate dehydratase